MVNIALVVLDTLRKDYFDEYFGWLPGKSFENAWSTSHWTVPVHASMFTGKYPSEVGVYANAETLDCPEKVLAEKLRENGYSTRAFSSNGNVSDYFNYNRGFEQFRESWRAEGWKEELNFRNKGNVFNWKQFNSESDYSYPLRPLIGIYRSIMGDYNTFLSLKHGYKRKMRGPGNPGISNDPRDYGSQEALEYVRGCDFGNNEFLFLNIMDAHNPYNSPEEYQTVEPVRINGLKATIEGPKNDTERIRRAYEDSVRYLSDMYKEIFEVLETEFDYVITLSDHGELLGEHNSWEHLCGIYPELIHVPLSIYGDGEGEIDDMVGLLDIYRTILDLADIKPANNTRGQFLLEPEPRRYLSEYHGLSGLHLKSLDEDWIKKLEHMNCELNGVSIPNTYYGYQTFGGWEEIGKTDAEEPLSILKEMINDLEKREINKEDYDKMSKDVLNRLEELGYV